MGLGVPELIIVAVLIILLFGGKKVASLGGDLGKSIRNFKDAFKEIHK